MLRLILWALGLQKETGRKKVILSNSRSVIWHILSDGLGPVQQWARGAAEVSIPSWLGRIGSPSTVSRLTRAWLAMGWQRIWPSGLQGGPPAIFPRFPIRSSGRLASPISAEEPKRYGAALLGDSPVRCLPCATRAKIPPPRRLRVTPQGPKHGPNVLGWVMILAAFKLRCDWTLLA